ncbi:MAG: histidine kinase [Magnetospirillum sp.]|nr:MAG: histidine kinase [Magnetospirillum sp.]
MIARSVLVLVGIVAGFSASAAEQGTADEAKAMTMLAVSYIKSAGPDKAYAEITAKDPRFHDRDLYVIVYDLQGKCVAHGANAKLVGKDLLENQDADGKFYVKERVEKTKAGVPFWQDYKFTDPVTRKVEPKSTYCERLNDTAVCVGIYKR